MSDGIRSVAQGWLGGSGSVPVVGSQGVRSIQAFWMGGASAGPAPTKRTIAEGIARKRKADIEKERQNAAVIMIIKAMAPTVFDLFDNDT